MTSPRSASVVVALLAPMAFALCLALPSALGKPATGRIVGQLKVLAKGEPKSDSKGAFVYVVGYTEPPPRGAVPTIRQKDKAFDPALLAITAGQEVSFPNGDPFFHNVFSLSPARKFDLGQFKKGESKAKLFPNPGVIDVYCNIHPQMAATILVLPNRRFATTAADGKFAIEGVRAGTWSLFAYSRLAEKPVKTQVSVNAGATTEASLTIDETRDSLDHKNKYGEGYRNPAKYR